MKKLSLLFVFVILATVLFTISIFAEEPNIANQAEISTSTGCWVSKNYIAALTDGNREKGTASSYSDKTVEYILSYDQDVFIEKLVIVVNGKGRTYDDGKGGGIFEEITNNNFSLAVKLTNFAGDVVYTETYKTGDKTEIVVVPTSGISQISLTVTCDWSSNCNIWEVEAYGHVCEYTELIEETPAPTCMDTGLKVLGCSECDNTKEEIVPAIGSHSWDEGVITTDPTETTEGVKTYTCTVCQSTKTEAVQPVGHNWDEGTVVAPSCAEDGYTIYRCTDEGCNASYSKDQVEALGHELEYVVTVIPTLTKEGEKLSSCTREGCDYSVKEPLPVATMADSSFILGLDNIISFEEIIVGEAHEKRDWKMLFDGNYENTTNSQSNPAGWFGLAGSTLTLVFDEEYYVLSADYYVWSNWNGATIEFFNAAGEKVAGYSSNGIQPGSGVATNMAEAVNVLVKSMKITINSAKYDYGNGLAFQELVITAHKHIAEGDTARYDEVIGCDKPGSYKKFCIVCEKEVLVNTKPTGEHILTSDVSFSKGYDMVGTVTSSCERCDHEAKVRIQPIFYSYGYSVREDGKAGISHKIEINLEALSDYEKHTGSKLVFGMVAGATPNFEGAPVKVADGQVVAASSKVILKPLSDTGYAFIEDSIVNIPEFAYDTEIVICPYIYDGKTISYINANTDSGETFETVSVNGLKEEQ